MKRWSSVLALAAWLSAPAGAVPISLDEFSDPAGGQSAQILNGVAGATASSLATGLAAIGGSRQVGVAVQSTSFSGSSALAEVNSLSSAGVFQLSTSVAVDAIGSITYDASGAGLDFDTGGLSVLRLEGVLNDLATTYTFTATTFGGGSSSCQITTGPGFAGDVSCALSGAADLANLDRIDVSFDPGAGGDLLVGRLVLVPEPATALLFGLGAAGLAWGGRARRRA
jgi:hypothetical protein